MPPNWTKSSVTVYFNSQTGHGRTGRGRVRLGLADRLLAQGSFRIKVESESVVLTEEGACVAESYQEALWQADNRPLQAPAFAGHGPASLTPAALAQIR